MVHLKTPSHNHNFPGVMVLKHNEAWIIKLCSSIAAFNFNCHQCTYFTAKVFSHGSKAWHSCIKINSWLPRISALSVTTLMKCFCCGYRYLWFLGYALFTAKVFWGGSNIHTVCNKYSGDLCFHYRVKLISHTVLFNTQNYLLWVSWSVGFSQLTAYSILSIGYICSFVVNYANSKLQ